MQPDDAPQEAAFRVRVRSWLAAHAKESPDVESMPGSADVDQWRRWSRALYDAGFIGLTWPREYGGAGLDPAYLAIWADEVAHAEVADHLGLVGLGMAGPAIIDHGTEEQKTRLLGPTLRCDIVWCQGFSEPGSGSDLASIRTNAERDGDHWVVNGQKVWSSWAHMADWCILLVRTDRTAAARDALSYLLLDMHTPGITVRPLKQLTGDPEFNEIFLDDVHVPLDMTLGPPGQGWQVAMTTLKHERATLGLGLASRLDAAVSSVARLLGQPGPDGAATAEDSDLNNRLVDAWVESRALRLLNLRVVSALRCAGDQPPFGAVTKLRWSEANQKLMQLATDALASQALTTDARNPARDWVFRQLRSRGNTIEAGTSEILRSVVAERVLRLPRSR